MLGIVQTIEDLRPIDVDLVSEIFFVAVGDSSDHVDGLSLNSKHADMVIDDAKHDIFELRFDDNSFGEC